MAEAYRVLVTGSRDWADRAAIGHQLRVAASEASRDGLRPVLVHGQCDPRHPDTGRAIRWDTARKMSWEVQGRYLGADWLAEWAALNFTPGLWRIERHPAGWARYGRAAGFRRNAEMVALGADVVLAFIRDGSRGATHCACAAERAGIPVRRFRDGPS